MLKSKVIQTVQNTGEGKFEIISEGNVVGNAHVPGIGIDTVIHYQFGNDKYIIYRSKVMNRGTATVKEFMIIWIGYNKLDKKDNVLLKCTENV